MKKYTVDYFIKKFTKIPANRWCTGAFKWGNKRCALGHCGVRLNNLDKKNKEADALVALAAIDNTAIYWVNDGLGFWTYKGQSPRTRILNFLKEIKANENSK